MGSNGSHFNVSLIVQGKVMRHCLEITIFEEKSEPKRGIEPASFHFQLSTLPGQTGSLILSQWWISILFGERGMGGGGEQSWDGALPSMIAKVEGLCFVYHSISIYLIIIIIIDNFYISRYSLIYTNSLRFTKKHFTTFTNQH